jgi:molecular chaperone GrpE
MLDILKSHGVEQIKSVGEKFEPTLHEAVTQRNEPGKEEGVVLEEFAKGYKLNGRAIRPSKVIVNKLTTELPVEQQGAEPAKQSTEEPKTTD